MNIKAAPKENTMLNIFSHDDDDNDYNVASTDDDNNYF